MGSGGAYADKKVKYPIEHEIEPLPFPAAASLLASTQSVRSYIYFPLGPMSAEPMCATKDLHNSSPDKDLDKVLRPIKEREFLMESPHEGPRNTFLRCRRSTVLCGHRGVVDAKLVGGTCHMVYLSGRCCLRLTQHWCATKCATRAHLPGRAGRHGCCCDRTLPRALYFHHAPLTYCSGLARRT